MASLTAAVTGLATVRAPSARSSRFAGARLASRPAGPQAKAARVAVTAQASKAAAHPFRDALPIPTSNVGITKEPTVDKCVNAIRCAARPGQAA